MVEGVSARIGEEFRFYGRLSWLGCQALPLVILQPFIIIAIAIPTRTIPTIIRFYRVLTDPYAGVSNDRAAWDPKTATACWIQRTLHFCRLCALHALFGTLDIVIWPTGLIMALLSPWRWCAICREVRGISA